MEDLQKYNTNHAPQLQQEHLAKFGGDAVAYRSVLSILEVGVWEEI
jgi:hypothetical protein